MMEQCISSISDSWQWHNQSNSTTYKCGHWMYTCKNNYQLY